MNWKCIWLFIFILIFYVKKFVLAGWKLWLWKRIKTVITKVKHFGYIFYSVISNFCVVKNPVSLTIFKVLCFAVLMFLNVPFHHFFERIYLNSYCIVCLFKVDSKSISITTICFLLLGIIHISLAIFIFLERMRDYEREHILNWIRINIVTSKLWDC